MDELLEKEIKEKEKLIKELKKEIKKKDNLIETLKRDIKTRDRLIKQLITDEKLKEYLDSEEVIKSVTELMKHSQLTLHKTTLKNFMTDIELLQYELLETSKQLKKIDQEQYLITSEKTLNKKLDELKALKLIEISKSDYSITATDKLAKLIISEDKRVSKSTKDEKELKIITEDKIIAARLNVLESKTELTEKLERYKFIYKVNDYSYVLGRKEKETLELMKKRIDYLVDQIKDKESIVYINHKPLYYEKDYYNDEYYKIIYRDVFETFENYLNAMCDTTRTHDETEKKRMREYYESLEQEILNRNIRLEKVKSKEEIEYIQSHRITHTLKNNVIIYIHEDVRNTAIEYLKNKLNSTFENYEIRKYTT